jgi:hypothetical protein
MDDNINIIKYTSRIFEESYMDQFELYLLMEKIKKIPLEAAEIEELNQTPEVQSTMNQMGLIFRPVEDFNETLTRIIENLKENPDILTLGKLFEN